MPHTPDDDSSRPIGLWAATATVVASMVGVGIFVSPGYTLVGLGSPVQASMAWLVGGIIAICGAIAYGALASRLSESGGEYLYLSRNVHPWAGFVAGWTSLFAGFSGPTAAAALAFEEFAFAAPPATHWCAILIIVFFAIVHAVSTGRGALAQALLVASKGLFLLGMIALMVFGLGRGPSEPVLEAVASTNSFDLNEFAVSLMWIALTYTGFNAAIYIADDVRDASRTVPRSLLLGTSLAAFVYLALVCSLYAASGHAAPQPVGPDPVQAPFAHFFATNYGDYPFLQTLFQAVVCVCLMTSVSAMLQTGPRVIARMAMDGLFPAFLETTSSRPPRNGVLLQAAIAVVLVLVTSLRDLLTHLGMTLSLCSAASIATVFLPKMRVRHPAVLLASAIYIVSTCLFAWLAVQANPRNGYGALAVLISASVAYGFFRRQQSVSETTS